MVKNKKFHELIAEELVKNTAFRNAICTCLTEAITLVPMTSERAEKKYVRLKGGDIIQEGDQYCVLLPNGELRKRNGREDWIVVARSVGAAVASRKRSVFRREVAE